jgi:lysophospholipase L1-like esterase
MRLRPFFVLLVIVLLTGCGSADAQPDAGVRIVVLGSSTAEGAGPRDINQSWAQLYREHCASQVEGCRVINLARGGYSTHRLLPDDHTVADTLPQPDRGRNISEALRLRPDAILINLPSNDAAYGISVDEQLRNYDVIMQTAQDAGVPVWVTTTQPRNMESVRRDAQIAMRDSTFARWPDHVIDFWTGLATEDGRVLTEMDSGDGIHLNETAHRLMFERVREIDVPGHVGSGARR